jgi:Na+-translocating ferredoxin:NAD+ oxidoreductase RnfD subunit
MNVLNCSRDPRHYQIAVLSLLVIYGVVALDFGIQWYNVAAIVITAMGSQYLGGRLAGLAAFDPRSPAITALSLTLLLRTDDMLLAMAAAAIAIGSKFLVRIKGKHIFNPANIAIVSLLFASDNAWVSTGQWGSTAIGALALACLGFLVLTRARRAETTIAFLLIYATILFGRAVWLGDPFAIPLHYLQNGALLIFAFFMISDPKTSPNTATGRIVFAAIVAMTAIIIQFSWYQPNGAILALVFAAPLVPFIDHLSRGRIYQWHLPRTDETFMPLQLGRNSKE